MEKYHFIENRFNARQKHHVNQHRVWDLAGDLLADHGEYFATASHSDVFEAKRMDIGRIFDALYDLPDE